MYKNKLNKSTRGKAKTCKNIHIQKCVKDLQTKKKGKGEEVEEEEEEDELEEEEVEVEPCRSQRS